MVIAGREMPKYLRSTGQQSGKLAAIQSLTSTLDHCRPDVRFAGMRRIIPLPSQMPA